MSESELEISIPTWIKGLVCGILRKVRSRAWNPTVSNPLRSSTSYATMPPSSHRVVFVWKGLERHQSATAFHELELNVVTSGIWGSRSLDAYQRKKEVWWSINNGLILLFAHFANADW